MPGKGTKTRNIRIDDELWDSATAQAKRDGTNISNLVRMWLTVYSRPRKPTVANGMQARKR
jgi:antitoxin component of RelBE/YafQ-DinJ toxin-antitoxin module